MTAVKVQGVIYNAIGMLTSSIDVLARMLTGEPGFHETPHQFHRRDMLYHPMKPFTDFVCSVCLSGQMIIGDKNSNLLPIRPPLFRSFATFGVFVAFMKVAAVPCRPGEEQDSERTMTEASDLWFERVEKAIRDLNQVLDEQRRALLDQATSRAHLLRAAAVAALVLSSAPYAQAYDYVDAHGYRHWCHQANCGDRKNKAVDENDLAWQPPPGVKWQVIEDPAKSSQVAKD